MEEAEWHDPGVRCLGMLLDGRAQTTGIRQRGKEAAILIVVNGHADSVEFILPQGESAIRGIAIDTNLPDLQDALSSAVGAGSTR